MLVSIIVPFYNVEPYFRRCLDSIVNQSYQNLEIILINDCSSDNSIDIAREYAQKDSRIKIIEHETSLHVGGARNTGLAAARGEYVWFIDSDDEIASLGAVDALVAYLQRYPAVDVIVFGIVHYTQGVIEGHGYRQTDEVACVQQEQLKRYINGGNGYFTSVTESSFNKLFRLEFLRSIDAKQPERIIHQDNILLYWLLLAKDVLLIPEILYYYYRRKGSILASPRPDDYIQHRITHVALVADFIQEHQIKEDVGYLGWLLFVQVFNSFMMKFIQENPDEEHKKEYVELIKIFLSTINPEILLNYLENHQIETLLGIPSRNEHLKKCLSDIISYRVDYEVAEESIVAEERDSPSSMEESSVIVTPTSPVPEPIVYSVPRKSKSFKKSLKKIIKMLLPYGAVRLIQICKGRL